MATDIFVGSVAVGVVPDARGWNTNLRRQLVPEADSVGREYGQQLSKGIVNEMGSKKADYAKAGEQSGGAFSDTFKKRLEAAMKALPDIKLTGDDTDIEVKLHKIKLLLIELSKQNIIDDKLALEELAVIEKELDKISRKSKDITVRFNTTEAKAQLALLQKDASSVGGGGRGGILGLLGFGGGAAGSAGQAGSQAAPAAAGLANPYTITGAVAVGLAALPFLAQAVSGIVVSGLGAAIAGMGALGAFGLGGTTSAQAASAQQASAAASQNQLAAQQRLNALRASGKATTAQLTAAENTLTVARNNANAAQVKSAAAQKDRLTQGQEDVRKAFSNVASDAKAALTDIGASFVPVMENIAHTVSGVIKTMTPVFRAAVAVIAGPLQIFADTVLRAFTRPEVQKSIYAIAQAFGAILTAFTPDIPGIFDSFAQAITRMASAISANPKAFADFLNFLFQIIIAVIDALAWLTRFATYIEQHFMPVVKGFVNGWIQAGHNIEHYWDMTWNNTVGRAMRGQADLQRIISSMLHNIAHYFDVARHDVSAIWDLMWNNTVGRAQRGASDVVRIFINVRNGAVTWWNNIKNTSASIWDQIWNNTIGRAIRGWHDLMGIFGHIRSDVINFFSGAASWLVNAGSNIISGLLNGIRSAMGAIGGWIKTNVYDPIVSHIKSFFGIKSPSQVMFGIGSNLIQGLLHGILSAGDLTHFIKNVFGGLPAALGSLVQKGLVNLAKLPAKALSALGKVGGAIGGFFAKLFGGSTSGGVARWAGVVAQALTMLGLPLSLSKQVLYQMQTESGGNPNAINLTDINAQHGDPSRGLLQTIGSTFAAYHVPGTSNNIYDPLANVAAAINYARHVYGPSLMSGGMGMGSGHGYDDGGWWPHGTWGWNMSGAPELVLTQKQLQSGLARGGDGASATEYHAHFDGLTGQAIESHVQHAFTTMSVAQGALTRNGRRS
jgi:phage-related protein